MCRQVAERSGLGLVNAGDKAVSLKAMLTMGQAGQRWVMKDFYQGS